MNRKTKWIATATVALMTAGVGTGIAVASGDPGDDGGTDSDTPLQGPDLDKASAAALAHTGGGTVVETEAGDDGAAYGVEIRLDDGTVVEIHLDAEFKVTGQETDDDKAGQQ